MFKEGDTVRVLVQLEGEDIDGLEPIFEEYDEEEDIYETTWPTYETIGKLAIVYRVAEFFNYDTQKHDRWYYIRFSDGKTAMLPGHSIVKINVMNLD